MTEHAAEFDIVVVGGGPAGIAAAVAASPHGGRVALVDEAPWLGGQIWRGPKAEGPKGYWLERLSNSGVTILAPATVVDAPASRTLLAESPRGPLSITWNKLIIATGARELFLPFPGWTLPGVFGAGGLQGLVKTGWPIAGKRVVIAGSGPLLLAVADALQKAGASVVLVAEQAPWTRVRAFGVSLVQHPGKLAQAVRLQLRLRGIERRYGTWPVRVEGTEFVQGVVMTHGETTCTLACDYLACGFGLEPNTELPTLLGCDIEGGFVCVDLMQQTSRPDIYCAGEPTGIGGVDLALVEGTIAGLAASGNVVSATRHFGRRRRHRAFAERLTRAFALDERLATLATPDTAVCRCEDVRYDVLARHASWREAKLMTRCGMGPCQGRVCGAAARVLFGWEADSVRPPILPTPISTYLDHQ